MPRTNNMPGLQDYLPMLLLSVGCLCLTFSCIEARGQEWYPRMMLTENSTAEERLRYDCDKQKYFECDSCQNCDEIENRCKAIKRMSANCIDAAVPSQVEEVAMPNGKRCKNCIEEDLKLTKEQVDVLEEQMNNMCGGSRRRVKRKIRRFADFPVTKWGNKIYYKVDGTLRSHEVKIIREAIAMWTKDTCLEFSEVSVNRRITEPHILFSKVGGWGCYSYIGRSSVIPQPIYLSYNCFSSVGYIAHEIGHSLGLFHEHQRIDRDNYIRILKNNITPGAEGNFAMVLAKFIEDKNVPYDLGSAMHYRAKAFSANGQNTVETANPLYQRTIGQRVELSFADLKIINLAYCTDRCSNVRLARPCQNRGYQDPKDCSRCKCPDGLSGTYCQDVKVNRQCGGQLIAQPENERRPKEVTSPGYTRGYYDIGTECSWKITAPRGYQVQLKFLGRFGLYCFSNRCRHWLEVRYDGDMGSTGPRFCCSNTPTDELLSENNEMLLVFKSTAETSLLNNRRGFKFQYSAVRKMCLNSPCRNGATCWQSSPNTQVCECRSGYSGPYCERYGRPQPRREPQGEPSTTQPTSPPSQRTTSSSTTMYSSMSSSVSVADNEKADIVILLDRSNLRKPWTEVTNFIRLLLTQVDLRSGRDRVGVITYAKYANVSVPLGSHSNPDGILDIVSGIQRQDQPANPYKALWLLQHEVLRNHQRNRDGVPDVAIIVTDSNFPSHSSFPSGIILQGAMQARESGISVVGVGIGDTVQSNTLEALSGQRENSFKLSYREMRDISKTRTIFNRVRQLVRTHQFTGQRHNRDDRTQSTSTTKRPTTTTTRRPTTTTTTRRPTTTPLTTRRTATTTTRRRPTTTTTTTTTTRPTTTPTTRRPTTTTTTTLRPTTPLPTTTTTTAKTTTPNDSLISWGVQGAQSCQWEKQGECSQSCGGCGRQKWRYVCIRPNGITNEIATREEPCNDKKCQGWCLMYIARVYYMPCGPECCGDYKPRGTKCVLDDYRLP